MNSVTAAVHADDCLCIRMEQELEWMFNKVEDEYDLITAYARARERE